MSGRGTARIFRHRGGQVVRLPKEFHLPGAKVRVRRIGRGVLLEPLVPDTARWFDELDQFTPEPFPKRGPQPSAPKRKIF